MSRYRDETRIPTVAEALDKEMQVAGLRKLAALVSSTPLPTRKAELAAVVLARLRSDGGLRSLFEGLDELQRAAVAEVVHGARPRFEPARFRAKYGRDPEWGSVSDYDRKARATPLRLFFYGSGVMPDDLRERLRAFVPPPRQASLAVIAALPRTVERSLDCYDAAALAEAVPLQMRETERAAQHDLQAVLRLVEGGEVAVSERTLRPGKVAARLIAGALEGGDFYAGAAAGEGGPVGPVKAFAWPLVVQAAGLARLEGSRLALTKAGVKALDAAPAATLRAAWARWLDTRLLDELSRVDAIKGQAGKGKRGLTAVAGRRLAIADALADCPLGGWVETDELFRYMRAAGHEFEVTRDAWRLYIAEPEYGSLGYDGYGGWNILQARYALCLLFEYAATLGLIDVAYVDPAGARPDYHDLWGTDGLEFLSRYDGLLHVRLTSLGAFCLGVAEAIRAGAA